ncbi:S8 family peptidase [Clostridium sp.]|uniref:S8 family peptidase n=1 Tax=Clostridium sp. TaxID=1506 RepID=UPI002FCB9E85
MIHEESIVKRNCLKKNIYCKSKDSDQEKERMEKYREAPENSEKVEIAKKSLKEYYLSEDYEVYFIEYVGDIRSSIDKVPYAEMYTTGQFFAYLFVENGRLNETLEAVPEIINIQKSFPYTLSDLKISNDLNKAMPLDLGTTTLKGQGVIVGIISTGIEYLNPGFRNPDGSTRIVAIWDQTLNEAEPPNTFIRGTEFTMQKINEAIELNNTGGDPYTVVNHKDDIGHGTAIAGLVGGRNLDEGDNFISVVPNCEFAIVKLKEAKENALRLDGIERRDRRIYQDTDISGAIRYLRVVQGNLKKPMVVYLALGSNSGGHGGETVLERYIDFASQRRDFIVVCDAGNQGDAAGHASGILETVGEEKSVLVNLADSEGVLMFSFYTNKPDKIIMGLTSPVGEKIEFLNIPAKSGQSVNATLGNSNITLQYFEESQSGGVQRVDVLIRDALSGVWYINLRAEYVLNGRYDIWLLQKQLLKKETRFLEPDKYTTLMTPSTAQNSLITSYYNQIENSIVPESGLGFTRYGIIKPSTTMGAIDILTLGLNNNLIVASGASVAGALLTGAVTMIYQWGNVEKNDPNLYPPKLRSYIISSTLRDDGGIYPNEEWGFGRFSFSKLIENLNRVASKSTKRDHREMLGDTQLTASIEKNNANNIYINIPLDVYNRLKSSL